MAEILIRVAEVAEPRDLEALQLRAGLNNPGDPDNVLAHADAIIVPEEQIAAGRVFVAQCNGVIAGFPPSIREPLETANLTASSWIRRFSTPRTQFGPAPRLRRRL
jgi:hypothetical protein